MIVATIVAFLALAQSAVASAAPQPNVWVAYSSAIGTTTTSAAREEDTVIVSQGSGRFPNFALRLREGVPGGLLVADAASPRNFNDYYLRASDLFTESHDRDPGGRARADHELLEAGIDHHRPATAFEVSSGGSVRVVKSAAARRHERCALRLLRASSDRLTALAPTEPLRSVERGRRSVYLEMAELPPRGPSLLLRLMQLRLPAMSGTRWSEYERRIGSDDGGRITQNTFRTESIRTAGREVGLHVDLLTDRTSPAARLCRATRIAQAGRRIRDECHIEGFIDRRDGWPIFISISRIVTASNHATSSYGASFSRLAPLEGFVPPPNPCPTRAAIWRSRLRS